LGAPKISFNPTLCKNLSNLTAELRNMCIGEQANCVFFRSCTINGLGLALNVSQDSQFSLAFRPFEGFDDKLQSAPMIVSEVLRKKVWM